MIIDTISDLHGYKPSLQGGDLLIIAGDLTANDRQEQYLDFCEWCTAQDYEKIVIIAGNHDCMLQKDGWLPLKDCQTEKIEYLYDSGIEYNSIKIWGAPWTKKFKHQNHKAMAFSLDTDKQIKEKWLQIPDDTDILVTHTPPYGILDSTLMERCGCTELLKAICRIKPKICVFGHIHECGGLTQYRDDIQYINASVVNERYQNINKPQRISI